MNCKQVCEAEVDALLVELLLGDEEEEDDVADTADDDQEDEEDQGSHQDTRAEILIIIIITSTSSSSLGHRSSWHSSECYWLTYPWLNSLTASLAKKTLILKVAQVIIFTLR